jgi:hypothetical protein
MHYACTQVYGIARGLKNPLADSAIEFFKDHGIRLKMLVF